MPYDFLQTCMGVSIGLNADECASWVQAWGSIGAIAGAFLVAWQGSRSSKLDAQRTAILKTRSFFARVAASAAAGPELHDVDAARFQKAVIENLLEDGRQINAECLHHDWLIELEQVRAVAHVLHSSLVGYLDSCDVFSARGENGRDGHTRMQSRAAHVRSRRHRTMEFARVQQRFLECEKGLSKAMELFLKDHPGVEFPGE